MLQWACLHPDCLLLAVDCFLWGMDLAMHVSGKLIRDWWYLAPQSALDYPLELFVSKI